MNDRSDTYREPQRIEWPAWAATLLAFLGLAASVLYGFHPHISQNAGSDFKTLYASTWCFVHGQDAFQFPNLAHVFQQNGVIEPRSWYGHSPVYPPLTLALLAPLCLLPMVPALYVWIVLGTVCMALATLALLHAASHTFGLTLPWKLVLVGMAAASPLTEIGLELGNVSVMSAALGVFAVAAPRSLNPWVRAAALSLALLLKPHIALWIAVAFFFAFAQRERKVLWCVCALTAAFVVLFCVWGLVHPSLFLQFSGYRRILISELGSGSMSPGNRDVMEVFVQITSFSTLLGYWLGQHGAAPVLTALCLLAGAATLAWTCWRLRDRAEGRFLEVATAWSAFGLIATYHRDADAMVLVLALPFLLARLRRNGNDAWAWCVTATLGIGCSGPSAASLHLLTDQLPGDSIFRFLLLRQASLAAACMALLFLGKAALQGDARSPRGYLRGYLRGHLKGHVTSHDLATRNTAVRDTPL